MANFTPQEIEEMLQEFFDVTGKRQYVGARYVPIFGRKGESNIEWDNSKPYEPLTIVTYRGNSYTSRQYVPVGVLIDDTNYWVLTGNYNGQVEAYREEMQRQVAHVESELESMHNYVDDSLDEIEELIPASEFTPTNTVKNYIDNADEKKVPFPILPDSIFGVVGQVLSTLANGKTKWVDPVIPDATDVANAVSAWLDAHPEATTTVQDGSVTWTKVSNSVFRSLFPWTVSASNYQTLLGIDTLDNLSTAIGDGYIFLQNNITPQMIANLPEYGNYCMVFNCSLEYSGNHDAGTMQLASCIAPSSSNARLYWRCSSGGVEFTTWSDWEKITTDVQETNLHTIDIFRKVVCCGDSYTSGHIQISGSTTTTNEDYAWPHYMETITGNEYINCGHSGATVLSWPTDSRGLPKAQTAGHAQAYIIGLMINDVNRGETLGTPSDIGTQAETYYGGLSRIVEALHAISNDAHIFIQTCPREGTSWNNFNQAVIDVVEYYKNTMHTHLLELRNYSDLYAIPSIANDSIGGHFTAIGYQQFAMILARAMSEYINSHISAFQSVHLIPTS